MRWLVLLLLLSTAAAAEPRRFSSGEHRVHLLELYSSEGCSSCPPAEAWLGGLRDDRGLWRDFVPLAFHVDYWDRLGWRDRLARREFTVRQYAWAGRWGSDNVYTPGFVLDGLEWRPPPSERAPGPATERAGVLSGEFDGATCRVRFSEPGDFVVHVALLGGGITSAVRAGENEGRTLRHEFVVLGIASAPLVGGAAAICAPSTTEPGLARRALAVWVTRPGDPFPLQATGGWLD